MVRYRAWKAPAVFLDSPHHGGGGTGPDPLAWDPLAPACDPTAASSARKSTGSTTSTRHDDSSGPPAKKAKKAGAASKGAGNAFDELLADELNSSTLAPGGQPSPSLGTPLASPSLLPTTSGATAPPPPARVPAALRAAAAAANASSASASASSSSSAATAPPHTEAEAGPSTTSPSSSTSHSDPTPSARLRARLSSLCAASSDPLAAAQADLAQRAAHARDEGKDRLALLAWVGSAPVRVGGRGPSAAAKGKGKAREGEAEGQHSKRERSEEREGDEAREGEGRTLWVFSVVRGGDAEGDGVKLDDLTFEGLERACCSFLCLLRARTDAPGCTAFASGVFTHASLFPALYPTAKSTSAPAYASPLSLPANAYPSALSISDRLLSIPLIAQPPPGQTPLQAAFESFRSAIASTLLDELAQQAVPNTRCVRLGSTVVFVPLPPSPSSRFPPLAPRPALQLSLRPPSLNRSSIQLHTQLAHAPLSVLGPGRGGARVRLAPLDAHATVLRTALRLSPARHAQLDAEWAPHVARACGAGVGDAGGEGAGGYVLCALDVPGGEGGERVEVVWPRALVLCDQERAPPSAASQQQEGDKSAADAAPTSPERAAADLALSAKTPMATTLSRPPGIRALHGAPLRARLAGQLLRGRTSQRRRDSDGSSDAGESRGLRSPVKRRTGDVWQWMGDEGRRREEEEEKENAARREAEKEKDARDRAAAEAPALGGPAKEDDKPAAAGHAQVPAAAPINMRTPMSLGASSTEAPSPAELFSLHQPAHTAPSLSHPPPATTAALEQPHDPMQGLDIDFGLGGMYPSPAEPGIGLSASSMAPAPAPVSTSAPMSTLETAFSEFDWGDGTFGTSGMGGPGQGGSDGGHGPGGGGGDGGGGRFDDGMMLGLTDDDFSFFDAPTPGPVVSLALSMPPPVAAPVAGDMGFSSMPAVSGMDAAFDLFSSAPSDLPCAVSAVSTFAGDPVLASTTSPQFPEGPSPALPFSFGGAFDTLTPNALELASGSPSGPALAVVPFSPALLPFATATPASLGPGLHTPHPASFTPMVVDGASPKSSPSRHSRLSAFEPVAFDPSHSVLDDKYDPRRGKFGLPSPDSDHEGRALVQLPRGAKAARSWYSTVCDPRIALAERLKRQRLGPAKSASSSKFRQQGSSATVPPSRTWVRRRLGPALRHLEGGTPSTMQYTADEAESEQSSSDSDMEDVMEVDRPQREGRDSDDEPSDDADDDRVLDNTFGSPLLGAASLFIRGLEPTTSAPVVLPTSEGAKPDPARDLTYHVVTEHLMHHPDLREATLAFGRRSQRSSVPISSLALATASTALSAVCGILSPSPLFADHTALAPLVQEAAPAFVLRTQQCVVETSCSAVDFWRPMGFEPLPGAKNVTAFVVYEDTGSEVHDTVRDWFRAIGSTYEVSACPFARFVMHGRC